MSNNRTPKFGDVYLVRFTGTDSEQSGLRPAVVFQNNTGNLHSPNVIVLPLTTKLKRTEMPTHVIVRADDSGLLYDSMVLCENPACISKSKLGTYVTNLPRKYMERIAVANMLASSAISFIDLSSIAAIADYASRLNAVKPA